jgi:HAD superfamily hydrolase (TIGR01549 family)
LVHAVFFDLFETLITEWENNQKKATYTVKGLGLDEHTYKKEWSIRRDRRMDGTFPDHQSVLRDILISQGRPINDDIIEKIHQQRVNTKLVPFMEIDNEIIQMLQTLKEMKVKIGLISNCTVEEVVGWEKSILADLFDDVVFSYAVKQSKPNSEIYLTACNNLKVSPENSLFIGDGGSNELQGASQVGMKAYHAIWFQPSYISEKITGFPKLEKPMQIVDFLVATEVENDSNKR